MDEKHLDEVSSRLINESMTSVLDQWLRIRQVLKAKSSTTSPPPEPDLSTQLSPPASPDADVSHPTPDDFPASDSKINSTVPHALPPNETLWLLILQTSIYLH